MADVRRLLTMGRRALAYELSMYVSLARWVARRPDVPQGSEPVGYARSASPVIALWIFGSAVEVPVAHLLIPWPTVRLVVLAIGAWGLLWMLGLLASLRVYPHLVDEATLRVRRGARIDVVVPWEAVSAVTARREDLPSSARGLQPVETPRGTHLRVGVSGEVNVRLAFDAPVQVRLPDGPSEIVELSFLVDDPRAFVRRARTLIPVDGRSR